MLKKSCALLFLLLLCFGPLAAQEKVAPAWPGMPYHNASVFLYNLDNQLYEHYHAWRNGETNFTLQEPGTELSAEQVKQLLTVINGDTRILNEGLAKCYEPHHAVFFYDSQGKTVAAFDVCFLCEGIKFYPAKQYKSEVKNYTEALTKKAEQQLEEIKQVFVAAGVPVFKDEKEVDAYRKTFELADTVEITSDSLVQNLIKTFNSKNEIIEATAIAQFGVDSVFTDNTRSIPVSYFHGKGSGILLSYRMGQDYRITHLETTVKTFFFNQKLDIGSTRSEVNRLIYPLTKRYIYANTIVIRGQYGKSVYFIHFNQRNTADHITYNFY
jgi:hypothetical protein